MSSQEDPKPTLCEYDVEIKGNITTVKVIETSFNESPTEEQKELLILLEKEFACRYTDEDEDYVATMKLGSTTPPLVPSYKPSWNRRRDGKRSWEDRRSHSNNRSSDYSHKRNYEQFNNGYRRYR